MMDTIKDVIDGILEVAEKERKSSEPYKDMFKKTDGKPFCIQLSEVKHSMTYPHIFNYIDILKANGYSLKEGGYEFLLALPLLAYKLEKDITEKEGRGCCVDKTYRLLHQEFYKYLTQSQTGS